ncbi:hypothetical protein SteCoe_10564 [Stentor coeruleus]|uniref:Uncharacterized protein n=1 Tax=Stentor coeruleus TaxID=5963 RepID=A0A1R2CF45_9CILI|nr:hypothetical protein SteCoe_10564 [Stentor coeruleus]
MDSNSFSSWTSKARLQEYKSKVDYSATRTKKASLDDFKTSLLSSLNSAKPPRAEFSKAFHSSSNFSHYQSLKNFRAASGIKARSSPSSEIGSMRKMPSYGDFDRIGKDRNFYTPSYGGQQKEIHVQPINSYANSPLYKDAKPRDFENRNINEVISIGTLSKATGVVGKGGLDGLPLAYMRQLKQFCNEVLSNLPN